MNSRRPRLAFVSPVFLFPNDSGGKIRTTIILRGLQAGVFDVTLIGTATPEQLCGHAAESGTICDRFVSWEPPSPRPRWPRALDALGSLPVNVAADRSNAGCRLVQSTLAAGDFAVTVFDFVHAAVLRPAHVDAAAVCFTHNVEAEIFQRHSEQARNFAMRCLWGLQFRKMERFEAHALRLFTRVVAVSERDAAHFRQRYALKEISVIPTGVDLTYFSWAEAPAINAQTPPTVVFTGSMDWAANVDGIGHFLENVWPAVTRQIPAARFVVVGRNPPSAPVEAARTAAISHFNGLVDDVRPHARAEHEVVTPLHAGGAPRMSLQGHREQLSGRVGDYWDRVPRRARRPRHSLPRRGDRSDRGNWRSASRFPIAPSLRPTCARMHGVSITSHRGCTGLRARASAGDGQGGADPTHDHRRVQRTGACKAPAVSLSMEHLGKKATQ